MTDVETVALREELARALMRVAFDPSDKDVVQYYARNWNARLDDANAILPIIARECTAALAAATIRAAMAEIERLNVENAELFMLAHS